MRFRLTGVDAPVMMDYGIHTFRYLQALYYRISSVDGAIRRAQLHHYGSTPQMVAKGVKYLEGTWWYQIVHPMYRAKNWFPL